MGPYRISFQEIEAYVRVTREYISPVEARIIRTLGEEFLHVWDQMRQKNKPRNPNEPRPIAMTDTAGIKAMMMRQVAKHQPKQEKKA